MSKARFLGGIGTLIVGFSWAFTLNTESQADLMALVTTIVAILLLAPPIIVGCYSFVAKLFTDKMLIKQIAHYNPLKDNGVITEAELAEKLQALKAQVK